MKKIILIACLAIFSLSFITLDKPTGLNIGDVAPDFTAKDQNGADINLKEQLKSGPVVLIFYRGEWCGYCNRHLQALQDSLNFITEKGATVIAISPEKIENIAKTVEKTKATYSVISDNDSKIMNAYLVAYEIDAKMTEKFKGYGMNLLEINGTSGNKLPIPAVYIINKEGNITYRFFDENYSKRASVKEILSNL